MLDRTFDVVGVLPVMNVMKSAGDGVLTSCKVPNRSNPWLPAYHLMVSPFSVPVDLDYCMKIWLYLYFWYQLNS